MIQHAASRQVYLDYQATTPIDPRVLEAVRPYFEISFGNSHSIDHAYGWEAFDAVQLARGQIADFIGADDEEIIFTSGATESCNLAIRGIAKAFRNSHRDQLVTITTEHSAVLDTVHDLGHMGFEITVLPVDKDGLVNLADLERALSERTALVTIMAVNNEIGVIQPLSDIGALCRANNTLFHTDATQAAGRINIDIDSWGVDMLSLSAHKVYGPKGIGALFVRSGTPIEPIFTGGGQENGLRPGTIPVGLVAGFGKACQIAANEWPQDSARMLRLTLRLRDGLQQICSSIRLFGHPNHRVAGNLSLSFPGILAHQVIETVSDKLAISTGAACSSGSTRPSRVLLALGLKPEVAESGFRVSLGRFTSDEEIDVAIADFSEINRINFMVHDQ